MHWYSFLKCVNWVSKYTGKSTGMSSCFVYTTTECFFPCAWLIDESLLISDSLEEGVRYTVSVYVLSAGAASLLQRWHGYSQEMSKRTIALHKELSHIQPLPVNFDNIFPLRSPVWLVDKMLANLSTFCAGMWMAALCHLCKTQTADACVNSIFTPLLETLIHQFYGKFVWIGFWLFLLMQNSIWLYFG